MNQTIRLSQSRCSALLYFLLLCGFVMPLAAQPRVEPKIERVALFKNGVGFFTGSTTLPDATTTVRLGQLPIPSFGTFWVSYGPDVKLKRLVTAMEESEEAVPIERIAGLLEANMGKRATLYLGGFGGDGERVVEGVIQFARAVASMPEVPSPYVMQPTWLSSEGAMRDYRPQVVRMQTDTGVLACDLAMVRAVEFHGDPATVGVATRDKVPTLRLELEAPAGGQAVGLNYLARGITWSPAYLLDITDPETAQFSARAIVVNEVADLEDVTLELVTGFPNTSFGNVPSPIALSQSLADFLNALSGGGSPDYGMLSQQVMLSNQAFPGMAGGFGGGGGGFGGGAPPPPASPTYAVPTEGTETEDLFMYPVEEFSLRKGETAWLPLFSAVMPYKHVYTWNVEERDHAEEPFQGAAPPPTAGVVWHSCRLTNTLDMPLTTAATEFLNDGRFVGQNICYYTPAGQDATIRINRAVNVVAEQQELEVERVRSASIFDGRQHDLVTVQGELRVVNHLDREITIEVSKALSGELLASTPDAIDTITAKDLRAVNQAHVLSWSLTLAPGVEETVTYRHKVYVRS